MDPQDLLDLQMLFHHNIYVWRVRPEHLSKREFRGSSTSRWNSRADALATQGWALQRTISDLGLCFSPTLKALKVLGENPRYTPVELSEVRISVANAPDLETIRSIEDWWQRSFEEIGHALPIGYSFAYLYKNT